MTPLPPPDSGSGLKIPILFGIVIALAAANIYLFLQLDQVKGEVSKTREALLSEISNLRETSNISNQTSRRHLETMKAELEAARRAAASAAGQAKEDAIRQVAQLERKVEVEQKRATEAVKQELTSKVEQTAAAATAANQQLSENVNKEFSTVKTDLAASKSEIDKTIADLKKVTGDLGVTSGLVATNGKELAALKALGERSYFEFNLVKSKQAMKLADITIKLKNADLKRNKYTIELVADDKTVEKKDKSVNEPLQFYMAKYRQPCEIVVNEVKKDRIVGYLAQPKVLAGNR